MIYDTILAFSIVFHPHILLKLTQYAKPQSTLVAHSVESKGEASRSNLGRFKVEESAKSEGTAAQIATHCTNILTEFSLYCHVLASIETFIETIELTEAF